MYLKRMEGHLLMMNFDQISMIYFLLHYKLPQVATLVGVMDVSPLGFYHVKTSKC
jgi:hypothetical protein